MHNIQYKCNLHLNPNCNLHFNLKFNLTFNLRIHLKLHFAWIPIRKWTGPFPAASGVTCRTTCDGTILCDEKASQEVDTVDTCVGQVCNVLGDIFQCDATSSCQVSREGDKVLLLCATTCRLGDDSACTNEQTCQMNIST